MSSLSGSFSLSTMDVAKLKVPELKKELKCRGLSTSGNKTELIERLQNSFKSNEAGTNDSIDDIEEDLLNDDDDEHLDEQESLIAEDLDIALDDLSKTQKRKLDDDNNTGPPKKIILKRNTNDITKATEEEKQDIDKQEKPEGNNSDKKVIKLSELTVKDRLEMRAKKFGVTNLSDDAKKSARAERFSSKETSSNSASSIKLNTPLTNVDILKQRAARFGVSVSTVMTDLEKEEKLKKRKERFGTTAIASNGVAVGSVAAKAARLERFKTTVK